MKYDVLLTRAIIEYKWLTVEAETQEEADIAAEHYGESCPEFWDDAEFEVEDAEVDRAFRCLDCGMDTIDNGEYPLMLKDEVWESIVPGGEGMLCRNDMEKRLGRKLTDDDLDRGDGI